MELLDVAESRDELSKLEIYYIDLYNATDKTIGYNIARGGIGGGEIHVHNGVVNEFITRDLVKYYLDNGWQLGILPGRKEINHSATRALNISKALKGKRQSSEHTKNHAESIKNSRFHWYTNGIDSIHLRESEEVPDGYHKGRIISDEAKLKNSLSNKGRIPWNKGLTKESDERIKKYADNLKHNHNLKN